jgi:hypothetical protein
MTCFFLDANFFGCYSVTPKSHILWQSLRHLGVKDDEGMNKNLSLIFEDLSLAISDECT